MVLRRFMYAALLTFMVALLAACGGSSATTTSGAAPVMQITSPAAGATLKGPTVKVEVAVDGFKLVPANQAPAANEGHLHFFVDMPASSVAVGQVIPLDQPKTYVHAGKEPFTSRDLELAPGKHTITVVAANAAHIVVERPAPASVEVTVE